jgi:hypothetical protein
MVSGGLQEDLILGVFDANTVNFDVSASALLSLKKSVVSDEVIQAMLSAEGKKHNPPPAAVAPQPQPRCPPERPMRWP